MTSGTEQTLVCYNTDWEHNFNLAASLSREIKESGFTPDLILAVSRGGLVPARIIADFLLHRSLQCLQARHWGVGEQLPERVRITGIPSSLESKSLLLVDDVADTGDTLREIVRHLHDQGAGVIKTATLHYKKTSAYKPDYYGEELDEWQWIVYPWSIYEDTSHFVKKIIKLCLVDLDTLHHELAHTYNLQIPKPLLGFILDEMKRDGMLEERNGVLRPKEKV